MNKQMARWGLVFGFMGVLSFACAGVESTDPVGSGGGDTAGGAQTGSGGRMISNGSGGGPGSGGSASGGANMGGGTPSGGSTAACADGDEAPCAEHSTDYPDGTAVCQDGEWDISECTFCTPNEEVSCGELTPATPDGTLTCDEDGLGWVIEPVDACTPCDPDGEAADCDTAANPTGNLGGVASCAVAGHYDYSECTLCDDEVDPPSCADETEGDRPYGVVVCEADTVWNADACSECDPLDYEAEFDCLDLVLPQHAFTGGVAYCGLDGSWDQSTCQYCGDGEVTGEEACDPLDAATTSCDALGAGFVNDDEIGCNSVCGWSTSTCTMCPGANCLASADCTGSACDNKECDGECDFNCSNGNTCESASCGAESTCDFECINSSGSCQNSSCKAGASCSFNCSNGGECENIDCTDATCSITCENGGSVCSTIGPIICKDGKTCDLHCKNGGDCSGIELVCQAGSTCAVDCDNNGAKCATATCEAGASCSLSCANSSCSTVAGF